MQLRGALAKQAGHFRISAQHGERFVRQGMFVPDAGNWAAEREGGRL